MILYVHIYKWRAPVALTLRLYAGFRGEGGVQNADLHQDVLKMGLTKILKLVQNASIEVFLTSMCGCVGLFCSFLFSFLFPSPSLFHPYFLSLSLQLRTQGQSVYRFTPLWMKWLFESIYLDYKRVTVYAMFFVETPHTIDSIYMSTCTSREGIDWFIDQHLRLYIYPASQLMSEVLYICHFTQL